MHWLGLLLVVAVLGVAAAANAGLLPTVGSSASPPVKAVVGPPPSGPGLRLSPPPAAPQVLAAAVPGAGTQPTSATLRKQVLADLRLPALGRRVGFAVGELDRPGVSWTHGAATVTPASTMKLLTTTAALETLGPDHRFTTSVIEGTAPRTLVLVGGGDPLLVARTPTAAQARDLYPQPASLQQLATEVASRLARQGVRRVRLGYDAALFTGPAVNPHWPSTYVPEDVVSPISALWINEGRQRPGLAERSADPALAAARAFAALLDRSGVKVAGPVRPRAASPASRAPLASVSSPPLDQIVEHILDVSDNEGAEVLMRQVAVASGRSGSSSAGVAAVRAALTRLGLDASGARFYDGSGLSRQDRLPVRLLVEVLQTAAAPAHPELESVVSGLPVAGFTGSLAYRFDGTGAAAGLGYVRAKTGTLTGVHGLAGIATTRSGTPLVFAVVADRVRVPETLDARADLDRVAAALSACPC